LYAGEIKLEKQFENAVSDFELFLKQIELKIKGKRGPKEVKLIQKMILKKYGKKQSDGSSFHEMALFSIASEHSLAYTMSLVLAHFKIPFLMEETRTKTKVIALEGMDQVVFEFYYNTVKAGPNEKTAERFMQIFREGGFITGSKDWPFVQKEFEKAYYTGGDENIKKALSSVYNMCFWNLITNGNKKNELVEIAKKAYFLNPSLRNRYALLLILEDYVYEHGAVSNEDKSHMIELANLSPQKSPNLTCVFVLGKIFDEDAVKKDSLIALKNWISRVTHDSTRYELQRAYYLQFCYYYNNSEQIHDAIASATEFLKYRKPSRVEQGILGMIVGNFLGELSENTPVEKINEVLEISAAVDSVEFPKQKRYRQILHTMLLGILLDMPELDEKQIKRSFDYIKSDLSLMVEGDVIDNEIEFWVTMVEDLSEKKKCVLAKEILMEAKAKYPNNPEIKKLLISFPQKCK
jgi:hypothetical protein